LTSSTLIASQMSLLCYCYHRHHHFVYWNTQKIELQLSQPQLEFWLQIS